MRFHKMELHDHTILTAYKNIELNSTVLQYKIYGFIRMPSKSLVGGSCQARVINNLQS